jgi:YD repeat-containing protein
MHAEYLMTVGKLTQNAGITDLMLFSAFRVVSACEERIAHAIFYSHESVNAKAQMLRRILEVVGDDEDRRFYDGVGNLTSISDSVDAGYNRSLAYDGINRLTTVNGPWGTGVVAYDGAGNITSQTFGSSALNYMYDGYNRLSQVSGARSSSFAYDAYGDVVGDGGKTFTYNDVPTLQCGACTSADAVTYDLWV